jgi:hypothetical protein
VRRTVRQAASIRSGFCFGGERLPSGHAFESAVGDGEPGPAGGSFACAVRVQAVQARHRATVLSDGRSGEAGEPVQLADDRLVPLDSLGAEPAELLVPLRYLPAFRTRCPLTRRDIGHGIGASAHHGETAPGPPL